MSQSKVKPPKLCFLCRQLVKKHNVPEGAEPPPNHRTKEHIPPDNLFPEGHRENLITVVCCYRCNKGFAQRDEQFRVWITSQSNVNSIGTRVMREGALATLRSSPGLRAKWCREMVSLVQLQTSQGTQAVPAMSVPRAEFGPYFIRLAKGLFSKFYPDVDYSAYHFVALHPKQFVAGHPKFKDIAKNFTLDERGNGVFRVWHRVCPWDRGQGYWMFQFYEAAIFDVIHSESAEDLLL